MTDLTQFYNNSQEDELNSKSQGALETRALADQQQVDKELVVKDKANSAYDATDLGSTGPNSDFYDYEGAYKEGNTFKSDANGGVELKNANFNPGRSTVASRDLVTGKQYDSQWEDKDGYIEKGRKILSEGAYNTVSGSTYGQTDGLYDVAFGIQREFGDFNAYVDAIQGPWNNDQIAMGWNAATFAHTLDNDIDTQGRRYYDEMREEYGQYEGVVANIPAEGYTEETLAADPEWIKNSRKLGDYIFGKDAGAATSDEEIAESSKFLVSQLRNNFDISMFWANKIVGENDPELARAYLALDAQYEAMDIGMESVGRWATAQANVTNLATFGGGVLITTLGKQAMQQGIRHALMRVAGVSAAEAGLGGAAAGSEDVARQNVEIEAGVREEVDLTQTAAMVGVGTVLGGSIGFGLNSAANKNIRDFAVDKSGKALKFMKQNMNGIGPMPGGPRSQRGSVGTPVSGGDQVDASFRLQELLTGMKDGAKPITVQQDIKAAINKGLITEQEVKWSGVREYLATTQGKVNRADMQAVVEAKTPKPELVDTETTQYAPYSLLAKDNTYASKEGFEVRGGGYRERMLVIKGGGNPDYGPGHFQLQQQDKLNPTDNMIGHSRVEASELDGQGGKMVLEIQSDFHKEGQQKGYIDAEGNFKGNTPISEYSSAERPVGQGESVTDDPDVYRMIHDAAHQNDIDPFAKNAMVQVWPYLDEGTKDALRSTRPIEQPYGKDWDAMGMRLEIQDSINSGDNFLAWPASGDQISAIEQWGNVITDGPEAGHLGGIIKRATTDRNKAMKKMGLDVEQVDMPQYARGIDEGSDGDFENLQSAVDQYLADRNMMLVSSDDGDSLTVRSFPEGLPDIHTATAAEMQAGEFIEEVNVGESWEWMENLVGGQSEPMSTVFNVLRLTPEVIERFQKEGMKMYGAAPFSAAAVAASQDKPERKRDANGRFSK